MSVRAKFKVTKVERFEGDKANVELFPVGGAAGGESDENKRFYALTPGGYILLSVLNPAAAAQFEDGAEYYVDFVRAEKA